MRLLGCTIICALMGASISISLAQGVPAPSAVGTVVDPSQKPLPGVPVEVVGPKGTTFVVTDETGKWSLYNLPPGEYQAKTMSMDNASSASFSVEQKAAFSGGTVTALPMVAYETPLEPFDRLFSEGAISSFGRDHIAEAIKHTKEAIEHGKMGHADVFTAQAEAALTDAKAAEKVKANPHMKEGITRLEAAIDLGKRKHADLATKHAEEALTQLEAAIK